jgi:hypothetical protein
MPGSSGRVDRIMHSILNRLPLFWRFTRQRDAQFDTSTQYWNERYRKGGNSGSGSYGRLSHFKAEVLNAFVAEHAIQTVIEFGCGDGNQLSLAKYPRYFGLDVASDAVTACQARFRGDPSKKFATIGSADDPSHCSAELALSLDVIYHLVEDALYESYMTRLFASATRYVAIYSSNDDEIATLAPHVRHRRFSTWVQTHCPNWHLHKHIANAFPFSAATPSETSCADFYIYFRRSCD